MKNSYRLYFTLILLLSWITIFAQKVKVTPIDLRSLTNSSVILDITQDDQGYIWFADWQGGVSRFDGVVVKQYTAKGETNLGPTSNRGECIASDGKNIWFGTFSAGLNKFDPETELFTHYKHDPSDPSSIRSDQIRTLVFDQSGMLWIGTMKGVDKFDPETETFTHVHTSDPDEEILREEHIRTMYVDREGVLWIGSSSPFANEGTVGGLFKIEIDKGNIEHYQSSDAENSLIDNRVSAIYEDSRGTFWVGTLGDGLHTMDRESGTFTRHQFDPSNPLKLSRSRSYGGGSAAIDHIRFINEDDGGNIWIGTFNGGLCRYDPISDRMTYYGPNAPYEYETLEGQLGYWSSYKSKDGLLWVGTWPFTAEEDLLYSITSKSKKLDITILENNSSIRSFTKDDEGGFYFGGSHGIWHEDKDGQQKFIAELEGFDLDVRPGARDMVLKHNQLWLATYRGLYNIDLPTNEMTIYNHDSLDQTSLSNHSFDAIAQLSDDEFLLGAENGIQIFNTKTKRSKQLDLYDESGSDSRKLTTIQDILIDSKNRTWILLLFEGIRELDVTTGQMTDYPGISVGENILYLFEDSNQKIWAGGGYGIYTFNESTQEFEAYRDQSGLVVQNRMSYSITEDNQKQIWVTTGTGIAKIDLNTGASKFYGSSWGLDNLTLTNRGAFATPNGDIIHGDGKGYFRFNSNDFELGEIYSSPPFLSDFYINESKVIDINEKLEGSIDGEQILRLDHSENSFSFRVSHIDYLSSLEDRELQYRLDGYDPNWRVTESGERVLFYNLPAGNYVFEAKVLDMNGDWQRKKMDIVISPPWWRTWWAYGLYGLATLLMVWGIFKLQRDRTIRIEREKTKDRELAQAKEIEKAYGELELAHTNLKATQAQLIQAEKMASLGELTAGIAHEIQNPLNFVNNFSEVSAEMIDEAFEELEKNDIDEAKEVLTDLKGNLEKISHHGSRASGIVKGMLDHSRASTGEKSPTDINALCDEYLRLSYHGLRAKDKSFNAAFETDFDESLPKVNVVSQDIGRVLLNVINNAFQACQERGSSDKDYDPKVSISTRHINDKLEIRIKDNGIGMSQETIDKVFQPFFTTKPTGQGTGLGMSISYDIVTKGHGGELKVESEEGKGSEFIIHLPIV